MKELTLEMRVWCNEAYREIQNIMGRYVFFRMYGLLEKTAALFSTREDASIDMPWGIYQGSDCAHRCFVLDHDESADGQAGSMTIHDVCTPVIEVSGDGRTAKGVWISPGIATAQIPDGGKKGLWAWLRYGCDFIYEDGAWKIWHMHKYGLFTVPTDKSWTDPEPMSFLANGSAAPLRSNDGPPGGRFGYTPGGALDHFPMPPEPYEQWADKTK